MARALRNCCFLLVGSLAMLLSTTEGLECTVPGQVKAFVKLSDPTLFDVNEQFLFKEMVAYSLRDYCSAGASSSCSSPTKDFTVDDVVMTLPTDRVSFCFSVTGESKVQVITSAIDASLDRFYGALQLSADVLQIEGVLPLLDEPADPDFPTWLIPFIVIAGLICMAAIAMIYFGAKSASKEPEEEKESLTEDSDDVEVGHRGPMVDHNEERTQL